MNGQHNAWKFVSYARSDKGTAANSSGLDPAQLALLAPGLPLS